MSHDKNNRVPPQAPLSIFGINPANLVAEADDILERARAFRDRLVEEITPDKATFANFVRPLVDQDNRDGCRLTTLGWLLARASQDPDIRAASREVQAKLNAPENDYFHRQDIAVRVDAVYMRSVEDESLDAEDRHFLSHFHKKFTMSGATVIDDDKRKRMYTIKKDISNILIEALKSATETNTGMSVLPEDLQGVPEAWLATLQTSEPSQEEGGREEELWLPLNSSNVIKIMQSAEKEATRRSVFVADACSMPGNIDRLAKLIVLRHELAVICGFKNHAELKMQDRMEENAQSVSQKLEQLVQSMKPLATQDVEELLTCKRASDGRQGVVQDATHFYAWDRLFYARKQAKSKYNVDGDYFSEYFEAGNTLQQMLLVFAHLFGLEFEPIPDAEVWHESVLAYSVWNSQDLSGSFLGYLYLDIFSRDGKYFAPHHMGFQGGFEEANGSKHYPVSALMCSFPPSTPEKPSLLQHRDVKIMFHELGHGIHFMVEQTRYAISHSRDYAEIPSRLLEHFIWVPEILTKLGLHYTKLERYKHLAQNSPDARVPADGVLPRQLAESMARTKHQNEATATLAMMSPGLFDLAIYSRETLEETLAIDTTELWNRIRRETLPYSMGNANDLGHGQASAPWVFRNTDVAYYTYVLSSVYAADIFAERFASDPMNRDTTREWRKTVLEKGSGQSELALVESFVGRPLSAKGMVDLLRAAER